MDIAKIPKRVKICISNAFHESTSVCGFKHKRQICIDVHDDPALHVLIICYTKNERKNYSYTP